MNRIVHGDCITYLRQLPDNAVTLLLTDPPYGMNMARRGSISGGGRTFTPKGWDVAPPALEYFDEMRRVSKHQIIWGGNHFSHLLRIPLLADLVQEGRTAKEQLRRLRAGVDLVRQELNGV